MGVQLVYCAPVFSSLSARRSPERGLPCAGMGMNPAAPQKRNEKPGDLPSRYAGSMSPDYSNAYL